MKARLVTLLLVVIAGCDSPGGNLPLSQATDLPLRDAPELAARFRDGDALFEAVFREADGLGPLYIRDSCGSCHRAATKGPGVVQKMAVVEADGTTPGDQGVLVMGHTIRPFLTSGATTAIQAPDDPSVKVSVRVGTSVFGRGYMEAIADAEILRVEAAQAARTDAIHGHVNRVTFTSQANPGQPYHAHTAGETGLIGRFGLKARIATLDDFAADAAQGDMGMTSPMRPVELPNPDGLDDDRKPGLDLTLESINALADYTRLLEIPERAEPPAGAEQLFEASQCAVCHVPSLRTRADYPIRALAGIDAPVFSDLLLHDMGAALADGLTDGSATSRSWRTAPLIGLRFFTAFLHDGRARTIDEAITMHGGEAASAAAKFRALSPRDRQTLLAYVTSL